MTGYEDEWFDARRWATRRSAEAIVPFVKRLIEPESIVDLGCGSGSWLAAFGVDDVLGVDGTRALMLEIPVEHFEKHDLSTGFRCNRTFDLALCIEVGEHLPEQSAGSLVDSLVNLAPVVLFSAAVPFQTGTGHVNEQWPDWWAQHFSERGYAAVDCVRPLFWNHPEVRYFHAQNLILYVRRDALERFGLEEAPVLRLVHPRLYESALKRLPLGLREFMRRARRSVPGSRRRA